MKYRKRQCTCREIQTIFNLKNFNIDVILVFICTINVTSAKITFYLNLRKVFYNNIFLLLKTFKEFPI